MNTLNPREARALIEKLTEQFKKRIKTIADENELSLLGCISVTIGNEQHETAFTVQDFSQAKNGICTCLLAQHIENVQELQLNIIKNLSNK